MELVSLIALIVWPALMNGHEAGAQSLRPADRSL
jgi:hypothetical protein